MLLVKSLQQKPGLSSWVGGILVRKSLRTLMCEDAALKLQATPGKEGRLGLAQELHGIRSWLCQEAKCISKHGKGAMSFKTHALVPSLLICRINMVPPWHTSGKSMILSFLLALDQPSWYLSHLQGKWAFCYHNSLIIF